MTLILGLIAIGIIVWFLTGIGVQGWVGLQTYLGAPKRRATDVSQQNLVPPPTTRENIATLESLGFQRLGEAEVKLPARDPIQYWILVNSDHSVQAETIFGRVAFSSFFKDKIFVVTDYPSGERITTSSYISHTIVSSIKDALDYHLQQIERFRILHGSPQSILDMTDYLRWELIDRTNHTSLKLRRFLWVDLARIAVFLYGAIIIMGLAFAWKANLGWMAERVSFAEVELVIIGLTLPAIFVPQLLYKWVIHVSKRDSRTITQKPA